MCWKIPSVYVCTSSLTHSCHGLKYVNILMNLYLSTFVDAWLGWFMYVSMIDEHIIPIENLVLFDFMQLVILTQKHVLQNEKYWWIGMLKYQWYNSKENKRLTKSWVTIYWTLGKTLFNFWIHIFAFILFTMHFCMMECSYDVIYLFMCCIWCVRCCNYIWV